MKWDKEKQALDLQRFLLPQNSALLNRFAEVPGPTVVYGVGFTCTVVLGHHLETMQEVAIKVVQKDKLMTQRELDRARSELEIHRQLQHPQIIPLLGGEENDEGIVLITPFASQGDLYNKTKYMTIGEFEARNLASQLVSALNHMHQQRIVMGDFKPHNVLLFEVDGRFIAQLCDFGFSEHLNSKNEVPFTGLRGTSGFFAPELLAEKNYDYAIDMFALGITMYTLLGGYEPFYPSSNFEDVQFDDRYWGHISPECKLFVAQLLALDPAHRLTSSDAMRHAWFDVEVKEETAKLKFFNHRDLPKPPFLRN